MPSLNGPGALMHSVYGEQEWLKLKVCQFFHHKLYCWSFTPQLQMAVGWNMVTKSVLLFSEPSFFLKKIKYLMPIFALCINSGLLLEVLLPSLWNAEELTACV